MKLWVSVSGLSHSVLPPSSFREPVLELPVACHLSAVAALFGVTAHCRLVSLWLGTKQGQSAVLQASSASL